MNDLTGLPEVGEAPEMPPIKSSLQSVEIQIKTRERKGDFVAGNENTTGFRTVIINPSSPVDDFVLYPKDTKLGAIKQAVHIKRVTRSPAKITFDGMEVDRSEYE